MILYLANMISLEKESKNLPINRKSISALPITTSSKKANPSNFNSFEEVYKTSYSHGLEAIYALENVDLKSVKKLNFNQQSPEKTSKPKAKEEFSLPQLEFDLGVNRNWITPFILREPIQVLGLSKYAEKCLQDLNKLQLNEIITCNLQELAFSKGLGQGHIDEIQTKLKDYLKDKSLEKSYTLDFGSWIKCLLGNISPKKAFILLERYSLQHFIPLLPSENLEIKRLPEKRKDELVNEVIQELKKSTQYQMFLEDVENCALAFIRPWMLKRQGIASKNEIIERLESISEIKEDVLPALNLFSEVFCHNAFIFGSSLFQLGNMFYATLDVFNNAQTVLKTTSSYFYKSGIVYQFEELITLLIKEVSSKWVGYPSEFIKEVLKRSEQYKVFRHENGAIAIKKKP